MDSATRKASWRAWSALRRGSQCVWYRLERSSSVTGWGPQALGDVLPGHLQVQAPGVDALGGGGVHEAAHLREDAVEGARLVAVARLVGVAMHRVDGPDDGAAVPAGGGHQPGQALRDQLRAEAPDEGDSPGDALGVEDVHQPEHLVGLHGGAALDANGILDAAHELHVAAVELPGALANPQHVRGRVVPATAVGLGARHGLLDVEEQRLMAGEEVHGVGALARLRADAQGVHERQGLEDAVRQQAVDAALGPAVGLGQLLVAPLREGAQQVQRGGGLVIGLEQPSRVRGPRLGVELHAVDDVAAVAGQGDAVQRLHGAGARLGELSGDAAHLHHRPPAGEGQHHGHLEQQPVGVPDVVGGELLEALRAVTTLKQDGLALGDPCEPRPEPACLLGEDERGQAGQLGLGVGQGLCVRIVLRHVLDGLVPPGVWRPGSVRHGRAVSVGSRVAGTGGSRPRAMQKSR